MCVCRQIERGSVYVERYRVWLQIDRERGCVCREIEREYVCRERERECVYVDR